MSHSPFHVIRRAHSSARFPTGGLPLRIYRTSTPFKRILLLRCPSAVFPYFLLGHSSLTGKSSLMRRPSDWPREGAFQCNGGKRKWSDFPFKISEDVGGWDSRHWGMTTRSLWQRPMKIPPRSTHWLCKTGGHVSTWTAGSGHLEINIGEASYFFDSAAPVSYRWDIKVLTAGSLWASSFSFLFFVVVAICYYTFFGDEATIVSLSIGSAMH